MKPTLLFVLLLAFGISQQSCKHKGSSDVQPEDEVTTNPGDFKDPNDVYVAGFEENDKYISVAKVWKNGVETVLSDGQKASIAKSVFVSGNDVYVAGITTNASGKKVATLWKNTVPAKLSDGTNNADASSVVVSGNDVYVAGTDVVNGKATPVYWKNGTRVELPFESGGFGGAAKALSVQGSDIYVAGTEMPQKAKFWRNGISTVLPADGANTYLVQGIALSGNDVYVSGTINVNAAFKAILWKNGVSQDLHLGGFISNANGVYVSGTDVYVTGSEADANHTVFGKIWKNGQASKLESESNSVTGKGVFVVDGAVYAAGDKLITGGHKVIMIWKNGKELKQCSNSKNNAEAYSLFVVKK